MKKFNKKDYLKLLKMKPINFFFLLLIIANLFLLLTIPVKTAEDPILNIEYQVINTDNDTFNIDCYNITFSSTNENVTNLNVSVYKYHVMKNGVELTELSGNLDYVSPGKFKKEGISLIWKGSGTYSVWLEFQHDSQTITTQQYISSPHLFERTALVEDFLFAMIIIIPISIIVAICVFIYLRKKPSSLEKRKKNKKEKSIDIIDLKKEKGKKEKQKSEKGKTQADKDLIFSVPQWEVDEEEEKEE